MAHFALVVDVQKDTEAVLQDKLVHVGNDLIDVNAPRMMKEVMDYLSSILGGVRHGDVRVHVGDVFASQTVVCDQSAAVDGTDDITIGGLTTLSVEAAPATEDQFAKGASDVAFAANLVAAINGHSVLSDAVYAVSDGVDTVTIYSVYPGAVGNMIALAETGNGFTLGAAALAGGDASPINELQFGYRSFDDY